MDPTPAKRLSALYYPYSRCVDAEALKVLALLYEEIVFVDPLEDLFREFLISSDKGCQFVPDSVRRRWNQNQADWQLLRERGVLRIVDPVPVLDTHDALLTAAYAADMADEAFVELAESEGKAAGPWKMLESRIPATVNSSFRTKDSLSAKLGTGDFSDYQTGVFAWERYDHYGFREYVLEKLGGRPARDFAGRPVGARVRDVLDASPLGAYDQLFLSGAGTCDDDGRPFGDHPYRYVDNVAFQTGEPVRILSFSQGASLSISQALLLADLHNLTPVTDSALHQQLLSVKYERALGNVSLLEQPSLPARTVETLERYSVVARAVLVEALSREFLTQMTLADALAYREANLESLERFWSKVMELSHELDDVAIGPAFDRRLIKLVDQAVLPELEILGAALRDSRRKIFGNLLSKAATATVPASAVVSLFAAFSGAALLALGVGAGITAFGLSLASVIDHWQYRQELGHHWLAFCTDLPR